MAEPGQRRTRPPRRSAAVSLDDALLRASACDLALTGKHGPLRALIAREDARICALFPQWLTLPAALQANEVALREWAAGVIALAEFYAADLERPELLAQLQKLPDDDPAERWQRAFEQADGALKSLMPLLALDLLEPLLPEVAALGQGTPQLPLFHGWIGYAYVQLGAAEPALAHLRRALWLCRYHGDTTAAARFACDISLIRCWAEEQAGRIP